MKFKRRDLGAIISFLSPESLDIPDPRNSIKRFHFQKLLGVEFEAQSRAYEELGARFARRFEGTEKLIRAENGTFLWKAEHAEEADVLTNNLFNEEVEIDEIKHKATLEVIRKVVMDIPSVLKRFQFGHFLTCEALGLNEEDSDGDTDSPGNDASANVPDAPLG